MKDKITESVDQWLDTRNEHQVKALETASKVFDDNDDLSVNTLEAIYGQETSYGLPKFLNKNPRGSTKPAGHFQQKEAAANESGLITNSKNDERFDIDNASIGAAKQLKNLNRLFSKRTHLIDDIYTSGIADLVNRRTFVIASYNAGQGRVATAQRLAKEAGKDPTNWNQVKEFLIAAGAKKMEAQETIEYVENVLNYQKEFEKKSKADKKLKDKDLKNSASENKTHWITKDGKRIFIGDKKGGKKK